MLRGFIGRPQNRRKVNVRHHGTRKTRAGEGLLLGTRKSKQKHPTFGGCVNPLGERLAKTVTA